MAKGGHDAVVPDFRHSCERGNPGFQAGGGSGMGVTKGLQLQAPSVGAILVIAHPSTHVAEGEDQLRPCQEQGAAR